MNSAQSSVASWSNLFKSAAAAGAGFEGVRRLLHDIVLEWPLVKAAFSALFRGGRDFREVLESYIDISDKIERLDVAANEARGKSAERLRKRIELLKHEQHLLSLQLGIAEKLAGINRVWGLSLAAAIGFTVRLYHEQQSFNQRLREANTDFEFRNKLFAQAIQYQIKSGATLNAVVEAYEAMVEYGLELRDDAQDTLDILVKTSETLGISERQMAQLAVVVKGQLNGSLRETADIMAKLAKNTALTANEAYDLVNELVKIRARFLPGSGTKEMDQISEVVARYEEALKGVGGQAGDFTRMISKAASAQGAGFAALFGLTPDMLTTTEGVTAFFANMKRWADSFVPVGKQNIFLLQALADMLEQDTDSVNKMIMALRAVSKERIKGKSLEEEWRDTIQATSDYISKIFNSLTAMLQPGLLYIVKIVNYILKFIYDMVEAIKSVDLVADLFKWVLPSAALTALFALGRIIKKFGELTVAALGFSKAATEAATATNATSTVANVASKVAAEAVKPSRWAWLTRFFRILTVWVPRLLGWWGLIFTTLGFIFTLINRYTKKREEQERIKLEIEKKRDKNFNVLFNQRDIGYKALLSEFTRHDLSPEGLADMFFDYVKKDVESRLKTGLIGERDVSGELRQLTEATYNRLKTDLAGLLTPKVFGGPDEATRKLLEDIKVALNAVNKSIQDHSKETISIMTEEVNQQHQQWKMNWLLDNIQFEKSLRGSAYPAGVRTY